MLNKIKKVDIEKLLIGVAFIIAIAGLANYFFKNGSVLGNDLKNLISEKEKDYTEYEMIINQVQSSTDGELIDWYNVNGLSSEDISKQKEDKLIEINTLKEQRINELSSTTDGLLQLYIEYFGYEFINYCVKDNETFRDDVAIEDINAKLRKLVGSDYTELTESDIIFNDFSKYSYKGIPVLFEKWNDNIYLVGDCALKDDNLEQSISEYNLDRIINVEEKNNKLYIYRKHVLFEEVVDVDKISIISAKLYNYKNGDILKQYNYKSIDEYDWNTLMDSVNWDKGVYTFVYEVEKNGDDYSLNSYTVIK